MFDQIIDNVIGGRCLSFGTDKCLYILVIMTEQIIKNNKHRELVDPDLQIHQVNIHVGK